MLSCKQEAANRLQNNMNYVAFLLLDEADLKSKEKCLCCEAGV